MPDQNIYMIAFDHLVEYEAVFVDSGEPTAEDVETIRAAKRVVFRGVQKAIEDGGVAIENAAMLVDEKYATDVMLAARDAGIAYSMPVDPPIGGVLLPEGWQKSLARLQPTWVKPLLWYNVDGDVYKNRHQLANTLTLQRWTEANGQQLLLEFLIRPEPSQLAAVEGDLVRYREEILPRLIVGAIEEVYEAGVRPALWKIEGITDIDAVRRIGELAKSTGADCLVLGSGADSATVGEWLGAASTTDGYRGFAVGRTIWQDPVVQWKADRDDEQLVDAIAERYTGLVAAYEQPVAVAGGSSR